MSASPLRHSDGRNRGAEQFVLQRTLRHCSSDEADVVSSTLMPVYVPVVERAFQLAASGQCRHLRDVEEALSREGYLEVEEHLLDCPLLRRQLREAIQRAKSRLELPNRMPNPQLT